MMQAVTKKVRLYSGRGRLTLLGFEYVVRAIEAGSFALAELY